MTSRDERLTRHLIAVHGRAPMTLPATEHAAIHANLNPEWPWECYGCGERVEALIQGADTTCPTCGSYELHLSDEAKAQL